MERIKDVSPNMYVGLGYSYARTELIRLTKLASETGQEVAVIPHLIALKDVMDSIHPGIKVKRPVPPEYVPPPLEVRWSDQHDRVLKRPVPPDVERPAIKWDDHEDHSVGLSLLHMKIDILCLGVSFVFLLLICGLFFK